MKPKEDYVAYRLEKAHEILGDAGLLFSAGSNHSAVSRLYYACFQAVLALFAWHEIQARTHAGVRKQLGLRFVKTGRMPKAIFATFADLENLRSDVDYGDFVTVTQEQVHSLLPQAEEFISHIESLLAEDKPAGPETP